MKNLWKLFAVLSLSFLVTACGGGGGSSGSSNAGSASSSASQSSGGNTGSISGVSTPGAIIGTNCYLNGAPCAIPSFTTIADASGNYSFPNITQKGRYNVFASHSGYGSVLSNTTCVFDFNGLFDCSHQDVPLVTPFSYYPGARGGIWFTDNIVDLHNGSAPYSVGSGFVSDTNNLSPSYFTPNYVPGAETFAVGSVYRWNGNNGRTATLYYDPTINAITIEFSFPGRNSGIAMDGVRCAVGSSVNIQGIPYYSCSSLGVTFDRVVGTIILETTPIYHDVSIRGLAYPLVETSVSPYSNVLASGSLTFPPF